MKEENEMASPSQHDHEVLTVGEPSIMDYDLEEE
jgi:hypothetical protein